MLPYISALQMFIQKNALIIENFINVHNLVNPRKIFSYTFQGFLLIWNYYGEALDKINLKYEVSISKKKMIKAQWQKLDLTKTRFKFIRLFLKFLHFQCGIGHALWSLKVEWEQCGCQLIASIGLALSAANQENEFLCILLLCLNT